MTYLELSGRDLAFEFSLELAFEAVEVLFEAGRAEIGRSGVMVGKKGCRSSWARWESADI